MDETPVEIIILNLYFESLARITIIFYLNFKVAWLPTNYFECFLTPIPRVELDLGKYFCFLLCPHELYLL